MGASLAAEAAALAMKPLGWQPKDCEAEAESYIKRCEREQGWRRGL
jgi:hypothetical protein